MYYTDPAIRRAYQLMVTEASAMFTPVVDISDSATIEFIHNGEQRTEATVQNLNTSVSMRQLMTLVKSKNDEKLYQAEIQNEKNLLVMELVGNWVSKVHFKWCHMDLIGDLEHLSWCERIFWKWKAKRKRVATRKLLLKLQNCIVKRPAILSRKHWIGYYKLKYQRLWMKKSLELCPKPEVVSLVPIPLPSNTTFTMAAWNYCVDDILTGTPAAIEEYNCNNGVQHIENF